jgi:hypothetical protein
MLGIVNVPVKEPEEPDVNDEMYVLNSGVPSMPVKYRFTVA